MPLDNLRALDFVSVPAIMDTDRGGNGAVCVVGDDGAHRGAPERPHRGMAIPLVAGGPVITLAIVFALTRAVLRRRGGPGGKHRRVRRG